MHATPLDLVSGPACCPLLPASVFATSVQALWSQLASKFSPATTFSQLHPNPGPPEVCARPTNRCCWQPRWFSSQYLPCASAERSCDARADAGARMAKSFERIGVVEHTVASDDMPILLSVLY